MHALASLERKGPHVAAKHPPSVLSYELTQHLTWSQEQPPLAERG